MLWLSVQSVDGNSCVTVEGNLSWYLWIRGVSVHLSLLLERLTQILTSSSSLGFILLTGSDSELRKETKISEFNRETRRLLVVLPHRLTFIFNFSLFSFLLPGMNSEVQLKIKKITVSAKLLNVEWLGCNLCLIVKLQECGLYFYRAIHSYRIYYHCRKIIWIY